MWSNEKNHENYCTIKSTSWLNVLFDQDSTFLKDFTTFVYGQGAFNS